MCYGLKIGVYKWRRGRPPLKAGPRSKAVGGCFKIMYTVYILQSENTGRYYVGYTSDMQQRFRYHNSGKNKSTKSGMPRKIVRQEVFPTKKEAWLREWQIKKYKGGEAFKKLIG